MRTTISLDEDIIESARYLAKQNHSTLGKTISDLARKGLQATHSYELKNNFPVFKVSENSPVITPEDVKKLEDE
ncbi:MAG: hypothetical protein V3V31_02400 [Methylococcales bacterium]